jgi:hypothetical protein
MAGASHHHPLSSIQQRHSLALSLFIRPHSKRTEAWEIMASNEENDEVAAYLARERAALGQSRLIHVMSHRKPLSKN